MKSLHLAVIVGVIALFFAEVLSQGPPGEYDTRIVVIMAGWRYRVASRVWEVQISTSVRRCKKIEALITKKW